MAYRITQTPRFGRALRKLDRAVARRILVALYEVASLDDPTVRVKPLRRELVGFWRLRVGDYRVVLDIQGAELTIVALDVGHRRDIYE